MLTRTRVTFGQSHHYLLGKPSIVCRLPICLFVIVLQHFISCRDIGTRPVARRKYRYCSRYCKSARNGIITLSLYCTQSQARASRRCFGTSALFAASFAWRTKSECKNSARYIERYGRSVCVFLCGLKLHKGLLSAVDSWRALLSGHWQEMKICSFFYSAKIDCCLLDCIQHVTTRQKFRPSKSNSASYF